MPDPVVENKTTTAGDPPAGGAPAAPAAEDNGNPLFKALFDSANNNAPAPGTVEEPAPAPSTSLLGTLDEEGGEWEQGGKKVTRPPRKPAADTPAKTPEEKKKEEEAAAAAKKKEEGAPPAKPVQLTRKMGKTAEEPAAAAAAAPAAAAQPKVVTTATEDGRKKFEETLEPEEKDQIELLRYAEKKDPAQYKGAADRMLDFMQKHADWIATKKKADPEYDFTKDNPEYQAWLTKNMPPQLTPRQQREFTRDMDREIVTETAKKEIAAAREEDRLARLEPTIKQEANQFFSSVSESSMPEEMRKVFKEKGAAEAEKLFPDEYEEVQFVANRITNCLEAFNLINAGVQKFNAKNEVHKAVDEFIAFQCADFAKNGGDYRTRDGKTFVTRAQWNGMPREQRANHWTFTDEDVQGLFRESAPIVTKQRIEERLKKMQARGWKRDTGAVAAPPPKQEEQQEPAARVRPAPAATGAEQPPPERNTAMRLLGM